MTARTDPVRTGFRRIRKSISGAFREPQGEGSERPRRGSGRHAVPSGLTILDVMEGNLTTVSPEQPLRPAVRLMIEQRISSVPVIDADGRIVGALNEKDLMKVFFEIDARCVGTVMTRDPVSFSIEDPLVDVVDRLMSSDFRRVLIHEKGRLVGVITRSHLMPALLEALEKRAIH